MTASKKESLSIEELEQVSGGRKLNSGDEQSSLFMQDGTSRGQSETNHLNVARVGLI